MYTVRAIPSLNFRSIVPFHSKVNELLEFPDNPHSLLVSAVDTAKSHSMFT